MSAGELRRAAGAAWLAAWLAGAALAESPPVAAPHLQPHPDLGPGDVVHVQLSALAHNDRPHPNAGIEITFRFASPGNRRMTGPLDRFIGIVTSPVYRPLIGHRSAEVFELEAHPRFAAFGAVVTAADGTIAAYLFRLSRQAGGEFDGCWMTDSVSRVEGLDPAAPQPVPEESAGA